MVDILILVRARLDFLECYTSNPPVHYHISIVPLVNFTLRIKKNLLRPQFAFVTLSDGGFFIDPCRFDSIVASKGEEVEKRILNKGPTQVQG